MGFWDTAGRVALDARDARRSSEFHGNILWGGLGKSTNLSTTLKSIR